jgi:hypothetical protein
MARASIRGHRGCGWWWQTSCSSVAQNSDGVFRCDLPTVGTLPPSSQTTRLSPPGCPLGDHSILVIFARNISVWSPEPRSPTPAWPATPHNVTQPPYNVQINPQAPENSRHQGRTFCKTGREEIADGRRAKGSFTRTTCAHTSSRTF